MSTTGTAVVRAGYHSRTVCSDSAVMESFALPVLNGERKAAILVTVDAHPLRKTIGNDFNLLRKNIRASLR